MHPPVVDLELVPLGRGGETQRLLEEGRAGGLLAQEWEYFSADDEGSEGEP